MVEEVHGVSLFLNSPIISFLFFFQNLYLLLKVFQIFPFPLPMTLSILLPPTHYFFIFHLFSSHPLFLLCFYTYFYFKNILLPIYITSFEIVCVFLALVSGLPASTAPLVPRGGGGDGDDEDDDM